MIGCVVCKAHGRGGARRAAAHSLVEVLVALGLVALSVGSVYGVIFSGMRGHSGTQEHAIVVQAAATQMEEIRNLPLDALLTALSERSFFVVAGDLGRPLRPPASSPFPEAGMVEFCRESGAPGDLPSVKNEFGLDLDLNGDGDLLDTPGEGFVIYPIKITICWRSADGDTHERVFRTMLTKRAED